MSIELSSYSFGPSFLECIPHSGLHSTAGLELQLDSLWGCLHLLGCQPSTPATCIRYWYLYFCLASILSVYAVLFLNLTVSRLSLLTLWSSKVHYLWCLAHIWWDQNCNFSLWTPTTLFWSTQRHTTHKYFTTSTLWSQASDFYHTMTH